MTRRAQLALLGAAVAGLAASFVISVDKFRVLANPGYLPSCSVSEELNCTQVLSSWQSTVFGFPNSLLGVGGFGALVAIAVCLLSGFGPPRWFRLGLLVGSAVGVTFVHWLALQSAFVIGAICLYCAVVWIATITGFGLSLDLAVIDSPSQRSPWRTDLRRWVPVIIVAWLCVLALVVAWGVFR